ncbi:DUF4258 domain-containing protein [Brevibacterium sp. H-BE7]|uniref:DUF4258 domain-containing protein n=1 Tax=unclassified Brevibacterium TaxID=2614124 RepID=UPI003307BA9E
MQLNITKHARDRFVDRGVTDEDVENAMLHYHTTYPTPKPSVCFEGPGLNGDTLRIWCPPDEAGPEEFTIKSVAWKGVD